MTSEECINSSCLQPVKMVKLTMDLIARGTSGYTKKKRDESMQHYLKRLTHLYLEDRNIDEIVSMHLVFTLHAFCSIYPY